MDGKPFIFDQLFRLNQNLMPPTATNLGEIPLLVIEDVLEDPQGVRETLGNAPAPCWSYREGGRNFVDYYDCRLRFPIFPPVGLIALAQHALQARFGLPTEPQVPWIDVNWFKQIGPRPGDHAAPHQDAMVAGKQTFTCLVYLNTPEECSGGTAFFRFRKTQKLVADEGFKNAVRSDVRLAESEYFPPDPAVYWENLGAVSMVTGRMLIFPAHYFHAAFHPEDSFFDFPRLTLAFWMVG